MAPGTPSTDVVDVKNFPVSSRTTFATIVVSVRKRVNSSTIARSPKKSRLITATKSNTAVVKEEDVLDTSNFVYSSHLSPGAVAAQDQLLQANEDKRVASKRNIYGIYTRRTSTSTVRR